MNNLPTARVDDILVHPRDNDLIVATHARGVWIADDITALQQATPRRASQDAVLFDIRPAVLWLNDRQRGQQTGGQRAFAGENPPRGAAIGYYLKAAASWRREDHHRRRHRPRDPHAGRHRRRAGINRVMWNLTAAPPQAARRRRFGRGGGARGRRRDLHRHAGGRRQEADEAADGAGRCVDEGGGASRIQLPSSQAGQYQRPRAPSSVVAFR